jgi:tRNA (mo5U34)-methyltransferase
MECTGSGCTSRTGEASSKSARPPANDSQFRSRESRRRLRCRPIVDDTDTETLLSDNSSVDLRQTVENRQWYATLDLGPGVTTPGWFDHRHVAPKFLPPMLTGARCLDVATFEGFWALQMQARGAEEVVGVDLTDPRDWDWPVGLSEAALQAMNDRMAGGDGFRIVKDVLGHSIERIDLSVYDISPETVGMFDFIYFGSLLLHVRDPVKALESVRRVCRGELCLVEHIDLVTTVLHPGKAIATFDGIGRPWWWRLNYPALRRVAASAGFELIQKPSLHFFPAGKGRPIPPARLSTLRSSSGRRELLETRFGDPHVVLRLRPR